MKINHPSCYGRFVIWAATKKISHRETQIIWRKFCLRDEIKKCDPVVGSAIKNFSRLFTFSHTTKSKLHFHSVWYLVKNTVQKYFSDYITEYRRTHINYELRVLVRAPNKESWRSQRPSATPSAVRCRHGKNLQTSDYSRARRRHDHARRPMLYPIHC